MRDAFSAPAWPVLRAATADLAWLLGRGYPEGAALKLVGDRHGLAGDQREAVRRAACDPARAAARRARQRGAVGGEPVAVDGCNVLAVLDSLVAGIPVFRCQDGALRDVAGRGRRVGRLDLARLLPAAAGALAAATAVAWFLDAPVSGSGRLAGDLRAFAASAELPWTVEVVFNPDAAVIGAGALAASADGLVIDGSPAWVDLAASAGAEAPGARIIDLG
ncbi:MAG: DUF434 domain-containing protein [bacterium]